MKLPIFPNHRIRTSVKLICSNTIDLVIVLVTIEIFYCTYIGWNCLVNGKTMEDDFGKEIW